jgi:hypothetical protein
LTAIIWAGKILWSIDRAYYNLQDDIMAIDPTVASEKPILSRVSQYGTKPLLSVGISWKEMGKVILVVGQKVKKRYSCIVVCIAMEAPFVG